MKTNQSRVKFKKGKEFCPYFKVCMDFKRSKELCFDKEWVYCFTFNRLEKLNERREAFKY